MHSSYRYYLDLSSTRTGIIIMKSDVSEMPQLSDYQKMMHMKDIYDIDAIMNSDADIIIGSVSFAGFSTDTDSQVERQTEKVRYIAEWFGRLQKAFPPDAVYMEGIFVMPSRMSASELLLKLHGALAVVFSCPILYISPSGIKKSVAGKGNASKTAVRDGVVQKTGIDPFNLDESDAMALYLASLEGREMACQQY